MDLIWKVGARAKEILLKEGKKPEEKPKSIEYDGHSTETQCPSSSNVDDQEPQISDKITVENSGIHSDESSLTPNNDKIAKSEETIKQTEIADLLGNISTDNIKEISFKAVEQARTFGTFLYGVANRTTNNLSGTAKYLKKTMEQSSILNDFNKEQDAFLNDKISNSGDTDIPPWVGCDDEENIKQQVLSLSSDKRNFLRSPPSGVSFGFNFDSIYPVAAVMLKEDPSLEKMRFDTVPKLVSEENFWRNYFYRVSLLKQSTRLSSMSHQKNASADPTSCTNKRNTSEGNTKESKSPPSNDLKEVRVDNSNQEFVSDDFQNSHFSKEDIQQEMKLLGVVEPSTTDDWEEELQQELQEYYEVVGGENAEEDPAWEKKVNQILENEKIDQKDQKSEGLAPPPKELLQTGVSHLKN